MMIMMLKVCAAFMLLFTACGQALPNAKGKVVASNGWTTGALKVRGGATDVDDVRNNFERYAPLLAAVPCFVLGADTLFSSEGINRYHDEELKAGQVTTLATRGEKTIGMFGGLANLLFGGALTALVWQGCDDNIKIANALALSGCVANEAIQQTVNHNEQDFKPLKSNFSNFMSAYRIVSAAVSIWALFTLTKDDGDYVVRS